MMLLAYLKKTFLESLREWRVLSLVLVLAPAFVFMMQGYFGAAAPAFELLVANHDVVGASSAGAPETSRALVHAWEQAKHPDGKPMFRVTEVRDLIAAQTRVKNRDADLLVEIPAGFAQALTDYRSRGGGAPSRLVNHADERNPRGSMAMALSDYTAFSFAADATGATSPLDVSVHSLGASLARTEFDMYVPALLVLAIITILFTAATALIREIDKGTIMRLRLSRLSPAELLGALAINQLPIGIVAVGLAYLAAFSCGFRGEGSLGAILVLSGAATLSVVAIAVITAAFLKSMFELLTVGVFPFFVLMFFSECMFPLPKIHVLEIAGHTLYANDVLPTAVCVRAFNKVLNHGAGLGEVGFELCVILALTVVYGAIGARLFRWRHLRV